MLELIPLNVPNNSILKRGWFGLCKFCHLHSNEQGAINWCKVMNNPHCCIPSVQATIIASSSSINTPHNPYFFYLVLSFKWFEKDVKGMCQCLLAIFKEVSPISIRSIVSFWDLIVHLLCCCTIEGPFRLAPFFVCATCVGKDSPYLVLVGQTSHFCHLQSLLLSIMVVFCFLAPISNKLVEYDVDLQER